MAIPGAQRPTFFEGQYLGAEDLTAAVEYGRGQAARHVLGGHTWGIAMGFQLKETPAPGGGDAVDVSILPGYGWDGFGRPLVLLQPIPLATDRFELLDLNPQPGGIPIPVWLRYREDAARPPKPGFEQCDGDAASRVQESVEVEVGARTLEQRQAKLSVAGRTVAAKDAVQTFLQADPPLAIVDEAIPQQTLPDPAERPPRWLIPLGLVRWMPRADAFSPGFFLKRTDDDRRQTRILRRYAGVVAETIQAADGVIRLKDRTRPDSAVRSDELVRVEGDLRIDGDARLFGGRLDFRLGSGRQGPNTPDNVDGSKDVPLLLHRHDDATTGGTTLRLAIGKAEQGAHRLAIGTLDLANPAKPGFKEKLVVTDHGKAALGTTDTRFGRLTIAVDAEPVPLAIRVANQPVQSGGLWRMPVDAGVWSFVANTAPAGDFSTAVTALAMTPDGKVGIGTTAPEQTLSVTRSLNVDQDNANDGTLAPALTFGSGSGEGIASKRTAGGNRFGLDLYTGFQPRLSVTQDGRVGVGTAAPTQRLHVAGATGLRQNRLYLSGGTGWSSLAYNAHHNAANTDWVFPDPARPAVTIELDDADTIPRFGVWATTPANPTAWIERLSVNGATGDLTMAHQGGGVGVGIRSPGTRLHVVADKAGNANVATNHVALLDNTSTSTNADVLALRVGRAIPGADNNFVTFFGGGAAVGRIEGTGLGGVAFISGGADFAEYLPRLDEAEPLADGDLVGVVAGRVTRTTDGAHAVGVVSDRPVVVGNAPPDEERHRYARIALVGQVAVKVRGPVRAGDFVVPSAAHDGTGVAVAAEDLSPAQAVQVVGQAWESTDDPGVKRVRAAVGLIGSSPAARLLALAREPGAGQPA